MADNKCPPTVVASSSSASLPHVMATDVASTPSVFQCYFDDICAIQRDQFYVCLVADPRWTQWISPEIPTGQQAYHNPCSTIVPWTPQCAISSAFSNFQFIVIETLDHNFYKDTCDNSACNFKLWDSFTHLNVDLNFYKLELCHIGLLSSHISDHKYIIALFHNFHMSCISFQAVPASRPMFMNLINGARRYLYSPLSFVMFCKRKRIRRYSTLYEFQYSSYHLLGWPTL